MKKKMVEYPFNICLFS